MTEKQAPRWQPTELLEEAMTVAFFEHKDKSRKGTDIPYISHLLAVCALVIENGGTEVQAAAALLHDVFEDGQQDEMSLGCFVESDVVKIVRDCTDTMKKPKPDWRLRKERYLTHLQEMILEKEINPAILVALADKVHNAETTVESVTRPDITAEKFFNSGVLKADYKGQRWWYESLVEAFKKSTVAPVLVDRLEKAVKTIFA